MFFAKRKSNACIMTERAGTLDRKEAKTQFLQQRMNLVVVIFRTALKAIITNIVYLCSEIVFLAN